MKALVTAAAAAAGLMLSGCGSNCSTAPATFNVSCESLRLDDAGTRFITINTGSPRGGTGSCVASTADSTVEFDVMVTACGPSTGNLPVFHSFDLDCELPALSAGTWRLSSGETLTIPTDGGVGECTR